MLGLGEMGHIGFCKTDGNGNILVLRRGCSSQGMVFKDPDAFRNRPGEPCYVPELVDDAYTGEMIKKLCNGQEEIARRLFRELDWQGPSTLMGEWEVNGEICACRGCGKLVMPFENAICPYCGVGVSWEEDEFFRSDGKADMRHSDGLEFIPERLEYTEKQSNIQTKGARFGKKIL